MCALRQKLDAAGEAIRTVRKVGYKLSTEAAMTDENTQKQPLSMTRRYRRG